MSLPGISLRVSSAAIIVLAALAVLGCGPTREVVDDGGVIAPATERPDNLRAFLQLPDGVDEIVYPWSEVTARRDSGDLTVGVLVADTDERRQRGLMYWNGLPSGSGMIFIWEETRARSGGFWNRNVPIDLDVAWLDEEGTIFEFSILLAQDDTIKSPSQQYHFVLEMPRGRFSELGITVGNTILIPETLLPD